MSEWTHPICDACWKKQQGDRQPYRVVENDLAQCCYCGQLTRSGIYVRGDPKEVPFHTKPN